LPTVLHLRTITGRGGGPEKTLLNSARFLEGAYSLHLAYIRPQGDSDYVMPQRARDLSVPLTDIPERGPADPSTLLRLSRLIRKIQPTILHAHDYKTNVLAVLLGRRHRIPVMTTVHGYVSQSRKLKLYYQIDRWALRRMDHVVVVSDDLYRTVRGWGVPSERLSIVENAIDSEQFVRQMSIADAKRRLGIDPARLVIGAVGRLAAEKAFDQLITATSELLRRGFDVELLIAGDGEQRLTLESLIEKLGCRDRIRLLGYRSDVLDLYQAMDVFALSSLREASPNVVLEAVSAGVPVVATRIAGLPSIVENDENGLLVPPDNSSELANALGTLLSDSAMRERLSAAGRRTIEERFSFKNRMLKIRAIYDRLLGRTANTPALEPAVV
jgi:glycosyltransferase involved in cell wall biosynthesis